MFAGPGASVQSESLARSTMRSSVVVERVRRESPRRGSIGFHISRESTLSPRPSRPVPTVLPWTDTLWLDSPRIKRAFDAPDPSRTSNLFVPSNPLPDPPSPFASRMATTSPVKFSFGSYDWICNRAALIVCPLLGETSYGIEPVCYSRNVEFGKTLVFQPGESLPIRSTRESAS